MLVSTKGRAQVTREHRESKRNQHACTKATEKRKLEVEHSNLRFRKNHDGANGLVKGLLPLGCLSVLRQEGRVSLIKREAKGREDTCCGRQRDRTCELVCKVEHSRASHNQSQLVVQINKITHEVQPLSVAHARYLPLSGSCVTWCSATSSALGSFGICFAVQTHGLPRTTSSQACPESS